MTWLMIKLIKLYQITPLKSHSKCRFYPTCSQYFIESLENYGFFKGTFLGIKRIFKCRPFGDFGYDPVPIKKEKN